MRPVLLLAVWCLAGVSAPAAAQPPDETALAAFALSPDGRTAAVAYRGDTVVMIFDLASHVPLHCLPGPRGGAGFLVFDGVNGLLVGAGAGEVLRWRLSDFVLADRVELTLGAEEHQLQQSLYDPDRQVLYRAGGADVYAYSLRRGGLAKVLRERTAADVVPRLAQAPDRRVLWVLDPGAGELRRVELEHFRVEARVEAPGAVALAADNGRVAVLCRLPADSTWRLELFDEALEPRGSIPIAAGHLSRGPVHLTFTGARQLSVSTPGRLVDVDLQNGLVIPFETGYEYESLHYGPEGSLFLRRGTSLLALDSRGRLRARHPLAAMPARLHDPISGRVCHIDAGTLRDEAGAVLLSWPAGDAPVSADLRGGRLAVGRRSGAIDLYDLAAGRLLRRLPASGGLPGRLCLAPEAERLAVQRGPTAIVLSDLVSGQQAARLPAGAAAVTALACGNGRFFAGDATGAVTVFRAGDGHPEGTHPLRRDAVTALAYAAGEGYLLAGARGGIIACDTSCYETQLRYRGHEGFVRRIEVAGRHFRAWGDDAAMTTWDIATEGLLAGDTAAGQPRRLAGRGRPLPATMAFNRSGTLLATRNRHNGEIDIWDARSAKHRTTIRPAAGGPPDAAIAFFDDSDMLITHAGSRIEYWDPRTGQRGKQIDYLCAGIRFGDVVKQAGRDALWSFTRGGDQVLCLDATTGDLLTSFRVQAPDPGAREEILHLALSPLGDRLAVAGRAGIYVYETREGAPLAFVRAPRSDRPGGLWFSPGGQLVVAAGGEGEAIAYDVDQGRLFRLPGDGAAFLDERYLAVFRRAEPGPVLFEIWDYLRAEPAGTVEACHGEQAHAAAAAPATRRLVIAGPAGGLSWWSVADPTPNGWLSHDTAPLPGRLPVPVWVGVPVIWGGE